MKKLLTVIMAIFIFASPLWAKTDKTSEDYLKNKHHFAIMNPLAEKIAQRIIKKAIKKEAKGKYKVKIDGYTLSSMKKGVFKYLEIKGRKIESGDVTIPYMKLFTATDYNRVDYSKDPVVFKSDIILDYEMKLDEDSINSALKTEDYSKKLQSVNKRAYPLFIINNVRVRIRHNKLHIIMEYNFPVMPAKRNRTFMVSTGLSVNNSRVKMSNIGFDNAYGNLPLDKVTNLVNLVDPLSFTLDLLKDKKCDGRIDSIKIEDDIVIVNGRIYIKGEAQ